MYDLLGAPKTLQGESVVAGLERSEAGIGELPGRIALRLVRRYSRRSLAGRLRLRPW